MAGLYLAYDIIYQEHRVRRLEQAAQWREWRRTHNPFDLHDTAFRDKYRLSPELAQELIAVLEPHLQHECANGLSVERQVLIALRFYATGSYQELVGDGYDLAVSQSSVSRCVRRVTDCINNYLLRRWVRFPMTPAERHAARSKFRNAAQPFKGAIGAMDCTYVQIIAPKQHEEAYVNHHGDHCLNVQVCDPDLKILNVNARFPGARHDYYIWGNSAIKPIMKRNFDGGDHSTWLIGDDGYFVEPWLMTPLKKQPEDTAEYRYNSALCSARSVIERCFGVWKAEFRCLSSQRKLMYDPVTSGKIVNACAVLHNMLVSHNLVDPEELEVEEPENGFVIPIDEQPA